MMLDRLKKQTTRGKQIWTVNRVVMQLKGEGNDVCIGRSVKE